MPPTSGRHLIVALDLARNVGWARGISDERCESFGHFKLDEQHIGNMAVEYRDSVCDVIMTKQWRQGVPLLVAYERPLVKHPHAAQMLAGLAWMTEYIALSLGGIAVPVSNTAAKKLFAGRTYSKKDKPYPGITRAHELGFDVETTDEADALAIWHWAQKNVKVEVGG